MRDDVEELRDVLVDIREMLEVPSLTFRRQIDRMGEAELIAAVAAKSIDPSVHNYDLYFRACFLGHVKLVRYLLENKHVPSGGMQESRALAMAAHAGKVEVVRYLLNDPTIDLNARDNLALRLATKNGHHEVARLLVEHRRFDRRHKLDSILLGAVELGANSIAQLLIAKNLADPRVNDQQILIDAVTTQNVELLKKILRSSKIDVAARNNEALMIAIAGKNPEIVEMILFKKSRLTGVLHKRQKVSASAQGDMAIKLAVESNNVRIVELLLKHSPDLNVAVDNDYPLTQACLMGSYDIAKRLIETKRTNPSNLDSVALVFAALSGNLQLVQLIASQENVDINAQDGKVFVNGCMSESVGVVRCIFEHPNFKKNGNHVIEGLVEACRRGRLDTVKYLLGKDVDPSLADNAALAEAKRNGHAGIVDKLLRDRRVQSKLEKKQELYKKDYKSWLKEFIYETLDLDENPYRLSMAIGAGISLIATALLIAAMKISMFIPIAIATFAIAGMLIGGGFIGDMANYHISKQRGVTHSLKFERLMEEERLREHSVGVTSPMIQENGERSRTI